MENQIDWPLVTQIMVRGFGAVFVIMVLLATITWVVGKIVQKLEKPKEESESKS